MQATASAQACLRSFPDTEAGVPPGEPPGMAPEAHRATYNMPPAPVEPLTHAQAQTSMAKMLTELALVCGITKATTLRETVTMVEHMSRVCMVPLCRGLMFMLVAPEGVTDPDELPPWAPSEWQYMASIGLPRAHFATVRARPVCMLEQTIDRRHGPCTPLLAGMRQRPSVCAS